MSQDNTADVTSPSSGAGPENPRPKPTRPSHLAVVEDGSLRPRERLALLAIANRVGGNATTWAGDNTLAADAGMKLATFQRALAALKRAGRVKAEQLRGPRGGRKCRHLAIVPEADRDVAIGEYRARQQETATSRAQRSEALREHRRNLSSEVRPTSGVRFDQPHFRGSSNLTSEVPPTSDVRLEEPHIRGGRLNETSEPNQELTHGTRPPNQRVGGGALSHDRRIEEADRKRLQEWVEKIGDSRLTRVLPELLRAAAAAPGVADPATSVAAAVWATQIKPGAVQDELARYHLGEMIAGREPKPDCLKVAADVLGRAARKAEEAANIDYLRGVITWKAHGDEEALAAGLSVVARHGWGVALTIADAVSSCRREPRYHPESYSVDDFPGHLVAGLDAGQAEAWEEYERGNHLRILELYRNDFWEAAHPALADLEPSLARPPRSCPTPEDVARLAALDAAWAPGRAALAAERLARAEADRQARAEWRARVAEKDDDEDDDEGEWDDEDQDDEMEDDEPEGQDEHEHQPVALAHEPTPAPVEPPARPAPIEAEASSPPPTDPPPNIPAAEPVEPLPPPLDQAGRTAAVETELRSLLLATAGHRLIARKRMPKDLWEVITHWLTVPSGGLVELLWTSPRTKYHEPVTRYLGAVRDAAAARGWGSAHYNRTALPDALLDLVRELAQEQHAAA